MIDTCAQDERCEQLLDTFEQCLAQDERCEQLMNRNAQGAPLAFFAKALVNPNRHEQVFCTWPGCNRPFSNAFSLKRHVDKKHEAVQATHPCATCAKTFHSLWQLQRHQLAHSDSRNCPCDFCGKLFKSNEHRAAHRKTHRNAPLDPPHDAPHDAPPNRHAKTLHFRQLVDDANLILQDSQGIRVVKRPSEPWDSTCKRARKFLVE